MEVDHSSQQPFVLVVSGRRHVEVRSVPARQGYYCSRRSQGKDDQQAEPEAPRHIFYREPGDDDTSDGARRRRRAAASSAAIFALKEVKAGDAMEPECAVCLRDFHAEEALRAMPCSHAFHQRCIFQWLRRNGICPLCRHQLPAEPVPEESPVYLPPLAIIVR
ncbi:unnamed protein product [Urochloa decumbens]|uniref:RING-type domain-containing protein n=1 Tax=Urochloa decumbens TaxID=240449 RepID=A0ABC8W7P0_9POAL